MHTLSCNCTGWFERLLVVCGWEVTVDLRSSAWRLHTVAKYRLTFLFGVLNTGMFIGSLVTTVFYIQNDHLKFGGIKTKFWKQAGLICAVWILIEHLWNRLHLWNIITDFAQYSFLLIPNKSSTVYTHTKNAIKTSTSQNFCHKKTSNVLLNEYMNYFFTESFLWISS